MAKSTTETLTLPARTRRPGRRTTRTASPGSTGKKAEGKAVLYALGDELSDLQERLFAEGRSGGERRVLLVLQGMDTSGKGGILRHAVGLVDPQGVHIKSFKAPTEEERRHDFLWRIERELPAPGLIGVFDRSHYEDVLIARVRSLAPTREIKRRYDAINDFEKRLVDVGHDGREVHAAHLARGAEVPAAGPARRPHEALEVQPRRHRRAPALGRLHACLRDRPRAHQHRARALARRTRRPEVVRQARASRRSCSRRCRRWT